MNTRYGNFPRKKSQHGVATLLIVLMVGLAVTITVLGVTYSLRSTQQRQLTTHSVTAAQGAAWRGVEVLRVFLQSLPEEPYKRWASEDGGGVSSDDGGVIIPGGSAKGAFSGNAGSFADAAAAATSGTGLDDEAVTPGVTARKCWSYPDGIPVSGMADLGIKDVKLTRVCAADAATGAFQVTAQATGLSGTGTAMTTSTVEVVYEILPAKSASNTTTPSGAEYIAAANIYRDLAQGGGVTVLTGESGLPVNINIEGDVGAGATFEAPGVTLRVSGGVTMSGGLNVKVVHSNGDVSLSGGAHADQILSRGSVTLNSSSKAMQLVRANGNVSVGNTNAVEKVEAAGNLTVTNGLQSSEIKVEGSVDWSSTGGSASSIHANGNILYSGQDRPTKLESRANVTTAGGLVTLVKTKGNATIRGEGAKEVLAEGTLWVDASKGVANGAIAGINCGVATPGYPSPCKAKEWMSVNVSYSPGMVVDVPVVDVMEVPPVSLSRPKIDVGKLEGLSNYAFRREEDGRTRVTVRNVAGLAETDPVDYFLFLYDKVIKHEYWTETQRMGADYLCPLSDGQKQGEVWSCKSVPVARLCSKGPYDGSCFSYNQSKKDWGLTGSNHVTAPGIFWFDGNLTLAEGGTNPYFFNTLMATGVINAVGAGSKIYAPAFAGYAAVCENSSVLDGLSSSGAYKGLYPTNLCDKQEKKLVPNALSNVALIAGSYVGDAYYGGDIDIGSGTTVYGSVMAGNVIKTGGNTTIHGGITAAGLGDPSKKVDISAKTVIDLTNVPLDGDISIRPCDLDNSCLPSGPTPGSDGKAVVLWTRYL